MTSPGIDRKQTLLWAGVGLSIVALLWLLGPVLSPFMLGLVLAYIFEPLVERLCRRAPLVVMSGGLGATDGDLTRQAVCGLTGDSMITDEAEAVRLAAWLAQRGRAVTDRQLRQAQRHQLVDTAHMPIGQRAAEQQRQHALGDRLHVLQAVGAQPGAQEVKHQGAALHHGHAPHVGPLRGDARRQALPVGRQLRQHPGGTEGTGAQGERGAPAQAEIR
ncbi:MAG: hypothetical protein J0L74_11875 [Burkholderiales bacterium]|nr:hypothetical protein [Burkholderiales bacterium]